ncbi:MAG: FAD-binding protein [Acidimicrobiales bacterium]
MGALEEFAEEAGAEDPVAVRGGGTQWDVGGPPRAQVRLIGAPTGVVEHRPEEMIVRVRAGTTVAELAEVLAGADQMVPLDPVDPSRATVGGVLSVGRAGLRRLRHGPVRDHVLEVRYVAADGQLVKAGAPVVKNVSGFDLVRLLVGSLGTLGLLGEVVLRTYPRPRASRWLTRPAPGLPPEPLLGLYRPSSVLWDGASLRVLLEGHPSDVESQAGQLGPGWSELDGPPAVPDGGRLSMAPGLVASWARDRPPGTFQAELGVGIVHLTGPAGAPVAPDPLVAELNRRVKERFDPTGRLNPGRMAA